MRLVEYLKSVFRLSSMIFTLLATINLLLNKQVLFEIIEYMLDLLLRTMKNSPINALLSIN